MSEQTATQQNGTASDTVRPGGERRQTERLRLNEQVRRHLKDKRAVYILPNMITMMSMFLGFLSMIWSVQGRYEDACFAILISALLDGLDGKVARLTHSASEFGVQLDSLADLIAFGLAPAMLAWEWQLHALGRVGVAAAFIYAGCGALRLARFNISAGKISKRFFIGLPIPAAGCTVVCLAFFSQPLPDFMSGIMPFLTMFITAGLGFLMVSSVRYFSFKEYDFLRAHPYRVLVSFIILLALIYSQPRIFGFVFCAAYIVGGLVYTFIIQPKRNSQLLSTPAGSGE